MAESKQIRVPPHSKEAEESVLGALLLDKDAVIAVAEFLTTEDFYDTKHKEIFQAAIELYEERTPIDILTVSEKLKKKKLLKNIGGSSYLSDLVNKVPTAAHVEHYGKIVKDAATKRSLLSAATKLVDLSLDEGLSANELLDKAESEVFSLTQRHLSKSFTQVKDALAESFDRLDELHKQGEGLRGVATGFKDLDDALAGMQRSNLLILAARPGIGKTSLALNIAQNVAVKYKRPVGFFSLEMSREELVDRLLVSQADIDAWKLKTGKLDEEDFTKLSNAMGELAEAPLYIDDTPGLSILEMRTKARRLQVEVGIDFLIVDYLQLAHSRNLENRVQEVSEISQGLKNLARELKIPVLAVSQLSRAVETRGGKKPQLSDLRESGCLFGDTLISTHNGQRLAIKDLVGKKNILVLALDDNLKLRFVKASAIFHSGRKKVYELKLKSGKIIKASGNHPFFKFNGWERLDKLKIGDRLATPRIVKFSSQKNQLSKNRLILLAHLIGDGCYLKRQPLHYTNSDMLLIKEVKKAALAEFNISPRLIKQKNWFHLYLSAKEHLARGRRNPIVKWLDEELGVFDQGSREKEIPEVIFDLNLENLSLFIKHLWSTDGCIFHYKGKTKQKITLYYASGSKVLILQLQSLLLRFGIISTISASKKEGYKDVYNVSIQGKENQVKFLKEIGIAGEKSKKVIEAISFLKGIKINPNNDVIPKEIWNYIKELMKKKSLSTREFHKKLGWAYSGTQRYKNGIGRERLVKINNVFKDKFLKNLSESDIYWDEVSSIRTIGVKDVYDITVPKCANFVANDFIVHNSIEQDSDVVMFLWKEDDEKPENVILDIAKHRNGPTRTINLFFKGDRIKFYGRETKRDK
ncbi:replicative DNA helicase [Patescibacteria group bacterium]|nr:replicative DNA helicase [Patescibacteria group bacterium]MBU2036379.1 replicative DNA helicase [Patescibacteria group bacterium]